MLIFRVLFIICSLNFGKWVASCTVVQWLIRPLQPGFDAQTLHSFLVLFHLIKVVRLKILVEEEGGHRVDVGIRCEQSSKDQNTGRVRHKY